mmetsp:Transcript_15290/g.31692  ORF Transcript_15290/g.31692 Transcript_15290/m.31692 type:complete len:223 (-) Transcript_15290:157-825(-)|eukprot:CAMPEP_0201127366 /NCGR_PEP_ID=MMETSP0850-20130426/30078_1 /ASSEMBLY_ACC=CAM_ASM_000622 /TAXON_ID=183588 /ORGANISM="Pseudo-nitzschia fraudulenta, Strain WWA7" /LENGTH=222 /DNA_ID=CAMNT_0047396209 /DNA_START=11 /DNA_END=679 /DNA_ORIENTATION=-
MSLHSPTCVREIISCVDDIVNSSSTDEPDMEIVHQQLVDRWFRDRFFVPRPYKSTCFTDAEDKFNNDIIDDGPAGRSMFLFSDNLVSKEIRSTIVNASNDDDSCSLRYRHEAGTGRSDSGQNDCKVWRGPTLPQPSPPGVVVVLDGSPLFPQDDSDEADDGPCTDDPMAMIQRTFSFDEQLPITHRRATSFRMINSTDDDYCYSKEQISFASPVTASDERSP